MDDPDEIDDHDRLTIAAIVWGWLLLALVLAVLIAGCGGVFYGVLRTLGL